MENDAYDAAEYGLGIPVRHVHEVKMIDVSVVEHDDREESERNRLPWEFWAAVGMVLAVIVYILILNYRV